jgi:hypothetical protein
MSDRIGFSSRVSCVAALHFLADAEKLVKLGASSFRSQTWSSSKSCFPSPTKRNVR